MGKACLLIVDVQEALVGAGPYRSQQFIENLCAVKAFADGKGIETIWVQHDGGPGDELEKGCPGWQIWRELAQGEAEKRIDKQRNSAFKGTELDLYLCSKGVDTIILVGMQTEYCIDATCKSAFDLGYRLVMPKGCTTTFDNDFSTGEKLARYFEEKIWAGRFAEVVEPERLAEVLGEGDM